MGSKSPAVGQRLVNSSPHPSDDTKHTLRLSIDCLSAKEFDADTQMELQYNINVSTNRGHPVQEFKSDPTLVKAGSAETKLKNAFASFTFKSSKN